MTPLENADKVVEELMLEDDKNIFDTIFSKMLRDIENISSKQKDEKKEVSIYF